MPLTFGEETVRAVGACDGGQIPVGVVVDLIVRHTNSGRSVGGGDCCDGGSKEGEDRGDGEELHCDREIGVSKTKALQKARKS